MTISCNTTDDACKQREREITDWAKDYKEKKKLIYLHIKTILKKLYLIKMLTTKKLLWRQHIRMLKMN